jgi:hypothetical protein
MKEIVGRFSCNKGAGTCLAAVTEEQRDWITAGKLQCPCCGMHCAPKYELVPNAKGQLVKSWEQELWGQPYPFKG